MRLADRRDSWAAVPDGAVADLDGTVLAQLRRHRATGFLVRPDRFAYGSNRDDLESLPTYVRALEPVTTQMA